MTLPEESPHPAYASLRSVLAMRDFRYFLGGRLAGMLATQIMSVAVGWHIYELTNSALALGYVGLAQFLPMVLLILPAGDVADRFDRRIIIALSYLVQAGVAASFLLLIWFGIEDVLPYYAALFLFGVGRAFAGPALRSFVPLLVTVEQLPRAIALSSSTFQAAVIVGPMLGGLLYIVSAVLVYSICCALFLAVALAALMIRVKHVPPFIEGALKGFARLTAGIAYIRTTPIVLGAISLDLFAVLLGGATALLPIYAKDILHTDADGLGLLRSAPAIGAMAINLLLIALPPARYTGLLMFACVAIFGLATIAFGLSENMILSLAALGIMGGSDMVSVYVRSTLIPLATPPDMLGRVSAVDLLFISASNELGEFRAGTMAAWLGAVPAVVLGGIGTLGCVALWMWMFPALRKVDRLTDVKPVPI